MTTLASRARCAALFVLASALPCQDPALVTDQMPCLWLFDQSTTDLHTLRDQGYHFVDVERTSTSPDRFAVVFFPDPIRVIGGSLGIGGGSPAEWQHRWQPSMTMDQITNLHWYHGVDALVSDIERNPDGSFMMTSSPSDAAPIVGHLENATLSEVQAILSTGYRIIDIEVHGTLWDMRYDAVMVLDFTGDVEWAIYLNIEEEQYLSEVAANPNRRIIDWERQPNGMVTAIEVINSGRQGWMLRDVAEEDFLLTIARYGSRIIDIEQNGSLWDIVLIDNVNNLEAYGTPCHGMEHRVFGDPAIGGALHFEVPSLPLGGLPFLLFGHSTENISATGLGAMGCHLYISQVFSSRPLPPVGGGAVLEIQIPDDPDVMGLHVYSQVFALAPFANPLGVIASNGVGSVVRPR